MAKSQEIHIHIHGDRGQGGVQLPLDYRVSASKEGRPSSPPARSEVAPRRSPKKGDEMTVAEAREMLSQGAEDGVHCPCCSQLVRLYKRALHAEMVLFLYKLAREYKKDPRPYTTRELIPSLTKSASDGTYLTRWGIIKKITAGKNSTGGMAGGYVPTQKGLAFLRDRIKVPSHVFMQCGKTMGFSERQISVREALGSRFDYEKLLRGEL